CWHCASLQLRSHSYGYAPSVVPCTVPARVARNIRFHMASYLTLKSYSRNQHLSPSSLSIAAFPIEPTE
ncbi:hypothetical protein, partial [Endozoicomonas sp. ONNA2]|uniref:hypothetical protein n=1 Tax=Endozoicomonas sp. ONNA2 TaxID=2828741 RepID=UPI002148AAA1